MILAPIVALSPHRVTELSCQACTDDYPPPWNVRVLSKVPPNPPSRQEGESLKESCKMNYSLLLKKLPLVEIHLLAHRKIIK